MASSIDAGDGYWLRGPYLALALAVVVVDQLILIMMQALKLTGQEAADQVL